MCGTLMVRRVGPGETAETLSRNLGNRAVERSNIFISYDGEAGSSALTTTLTYSRDCLALYVSSERASRLGEKPAVKGRGVLPSSTAVLWKSHQCIAATSIQQKNNHPGDTKSAVADSEDDQTASPTAAPTEPDRPRQDLRWEVTQKLIDAAEAGNTPWQRPWPAQSLRPENGATQNGCRGINRLLLSLAGQEFADSRWVSVLKDQKGVLKKNCSASTMRTPCFSSLFRALPF